MDQKLKSFGGNQRGGRIILLGDGTEVLTDSDDTEMFDHGEEDKDLASQVPKGQSAIKTEPEINPAVIPDKIDVSDPKIKALAESALPNSTEDKRSEK
jgi:protein phosphatase PTC2/3